MNDRRYQVFVSSTFRDLIVERQAVLQAILGLNLFPAGMELFPASDSTPWNVIERYIRESDLYILVVGGKYGSVDENGVSYTEREYDFARKHKKLILPFLHKSPSELPAKDNEPKASARQKLDAFRQKVQRHHCKYWTSSEDLKYEVSVALSLAVKDGDLLGWVRPDQSQGRSSFNSFEQTFAELCVQQQIQEGRLAELLQLFSACGNATTVRPGFRSVCACLARLSGSPAAVSYLASFGPQDKEYYWVAAYEHALLQFAKPVSFSQLQRTVLVDQIPATYSRLWDSLLGIAALADKDRESASNFYCSVNASTHNDDALDAYAAIPTAILAAAHNDQENLKHYLDIARSINRNRRYPSHGYPYIGLTAEFDRSFVTTVINACDDPFPKKHIQALRGHAHVIARFARVLRLCDTALETVVKVSENWRHQLDKQGIQQRLLEFEQRVLANAGTLFLRV